MFSWNGWIELVSPAGVISQTYFSGGEGFFSAAHGWLVPESGDWIIRVGHSSTTFAGDYYLFVNVLAPSTESEVEPNDTIATAQALTFNESMKISAFTDDADPVDVFAIDFRGNSGVVIRLSGADPGHELRLLNDAGVALVASGPSHDGSNQPSLSYFFATGGTYYLEFAKGDASGAAEILIAEN